MSRVDPVSIRKTLEIDAGHRVVGHEGKCLSYHGHRYKFRITARGPELDSLGMVIDFSVIKQLIGTWLEEYWDHAMIMWEEDPYHYLWSEVGQPLHGMKYFLLPTNPTAENIALYLKDKANFLLANTEVKVTKIECWETPSCSAEVGSS